MELSSSWKSRCLQKQSLWHIARTLCRLHCKQTLPSLNHSDFQLKNPNKTCVSGFTVMLSRCSKHSKLPHIFLVPRNTVYKYNLYNTLQVYLTCDCIACNKPNQLLGVTVYISVISKANTVQILSYYIWFGHPVTGNLIQCVGETTQTLEQAVCHYVRIE